MNQIQKLILEAIQAELKEVALGASDAEARGLALLATHVNGVKQFVLYDPAIVRKSFRVDRGQPIATGFLSPVIGTIRLQENRNCQAWEVLATAAEKGYGPLMYDLAFSSVGQAGLMADRESVSNGAKNIWRFIADKRANEFTKKPLPANCQHHTKEQYLNFAYVIKQPISGFETLIARSEKFIAELTTELNYDGAKLIRIMASDLFAKKMSYVDEAAIPFQHATKNSFAMHTTKEGGVLTVILYETSSTEPVVLGIIDMVKIPSCSTWRIVTSAAIKGYGPLMYDIAFSIAGDSGLMSDRTRVSDDAKKIWNFLANKRTDEFEKIPVKPTCRFKGVDSAHPLNHKFVLKNRLNYGELEANHQKNMAQMTPKDKKKFLENLEEKANDFFNEKYFGVKQ